METRKISRRRPRSVKRRRSLSFHVVVLQRTAKKCTEIYNARAKLSFCSLNLLFGDVLRRCRRRRGLLKVAVDDTTGIFISRIWVQLNGFLLTRRIQVTDFTTVRMNLLWCCLQARQVLVYNEAMPVEIASEADFLANYVNEWTYMRGFPIRQSHAIKLVTRDSKHEPNVGLFAGSELVWYI